MEYRLSRLGLEFKSEVVETSHVTSKASEKRAVYSMTLSISWRLRTVAAPPTQNYCMDPTRVISSGSKSTCTTITNVFSLRSSWRTMSPDVEYSSSFGSLEAMRSLASPFRFFQRYSRLGPARTLKWANPIHKLKHSTSISASLRTGIKQMYSQQQK